MSPEAEAVNTIYDYTRLDPKVLRNPEVAHLTVDGNHILGSQSIKGLDIDARELPEGISVNLILHEGVKVLHPVHLCFAMLPAEGVQRIELEVDIEAGAQVSFLAHCVFPNATKVKHVMEAHIRVREGAKYAYKEEHVHSPSGGVEVYPKARVEVGQNAEFLTEFDLIRGRVGLIDIDYETVSAAHSRIEMISRISGKADDRIRINETATLDGEYARGALTSKIAVIDNCRAEVNNRLTATAPFARGHVDCKEIVQDNAVATAVPIVEVRHPQAHVTHEAAIGSVDHKQLETLLSRGLSEDEAVELIIDGMLRS